jgi:hypothetical protein
MPFHTNHPPRRTSHPWKAGAGRRIAKGRNIAAARAAKQREALAQAIEAELYDVEALAVEAQVRK